MKKKKIKNKQNKEANREQRMQYRTYIIKTIIMENLSQIK